MTESLWIKDDEATPGPPPSPAGPGLRLSEARQMKNLTVARVAQQLRLDPRSVVALENNDYDHLPEPIYVSGYLRNYARLLGLSEQEIVGAYRQVDRPSPPILSELTRNASRRPSINQSAVQWSAVVVVVIGLIVLAWGMSGKKPPPPVADQVTDVTPGPAVPPPQLATTVPDASQGEPPPVATTPAPAEGNGDAKPMSSAMQDAGQTPVPPVPPVASAQAAPPVASAQAAPPAQANPSATLALHFVDNSWVEVTDATGAQVFYALGEAGETRTVQGEPPFKVLLGYSPGVSIEYNGVAFDQSRFASRSNVARFTIGR